MIKFYNKNTKKLAIILLSGTIVLSVSGCYEKISSKYSSYSKTTSQLSEEENESYLVSETAEPEESSKIIESSNESKIESKIESSIQSIEESILESVSSIEESSKKIDIDEVTDLLDSIDNKIKNNLYKVGDEILEDYDVLYDFIFENGTIKGYTFDEVKDDVKAKAMSVYLKIDETIDSKFPNIKAKINEVYGNTKDKVKNKLSEYKVKLEDKIIEEIGEEEYSNYINLKDEFVSAFEKQNKSDIDELKELGKEFLKSIRER